MNLRELKEVFGRLVSPEVVDKLISGDAFSEARELKERDLHIVLILVTEAHPLKLAGYIGTLTDLAKAHGAALESITCNLVVLTFGQHTAKESATEKRSKFVESLQTKLGKAVRIVHGQGAAQMGLLGGEDLVSYSFLVPRFTEALKILVNLRDGETVEMKFS